MANTLKTKSRSLKLGAQKKEMTTMLTIRYPTNAEKVTTTVTMTNTTEMTEAPTKTDLRSTVWASDTTVGKETIIKVAEIVKTVEAVIKAMAKLELEEPPKENINKKGPRIILKRIKMTLNQTHHSLTSRTGSKRRTTTPRVTKIPIRSHNRNLTTSRITNSNGTTRKSSKVTTARRP